jgi:hypothetical protein
MRKGDELAVSRPFPRRAMIAVFGLPAYPVSKSAESLIQDLIDALRLVTLYIMPEVMPLLAGLLDANSCMVSRRYLCGFTAVSWMRTS